MGPFLSPIFSSPPPDQSDPLSINSRVVLEFPDSNSYSYSEETVSHQFFFGTFKNRTQLSPYTLIHRLFIGRGISVCWFVPPMKVARLSSLFCVLVFCLGFCRFWPLLSAVNHSFQSNYAIHSSSFGGTLGDL